MGSREEIVSAVAYALRFKVGQAKWQGDIDIRLAAEAIVAHLCRYIIRHDPPPFPGPGYYPEAPKDR